MTGRRSRLLRLCVVTLAGWAAATSTSGAANGYFVPTGSMGIDRWGLAAAPLPDGTVLVTGGVGPTTDLSTAEIFDPSSNSFAPTGSMSSVRIHMAAAPLPDGRVLVAGGGSDSELAQATAEIYDPVTASFVPTGSMLTERAAFVAASLSDGRVLIAGGSDNSDSFVASAEIYDASSGTFSPTGSLIGRNGVFATATLPGGRVLVMEYGGESEIYDEASGEFSPGPPIFSEPRFTAAAPLPDGSLLLTGARDITTTGTFDPATNAFSAGASMSVSRSSPGVAALPGGRVLVAGGLIMGVGSLSSAEIYVTPPQAQADGIDFGDIVTGRRSGEQAVTVTNLGAQLLRIKPGASVSGSAAGEFAMGTDRCGGRDLAYGETCSIQMRFTPREAGSRAATITIESNTGSTAVALNGTGVSSGSGEPPQTPLPPSPPSSPIKPKITAIKVRKGLSRSGRVAVARIVCESACEVSGAKGRLKIGRRSNRIKVTVPRRLGDKGKGTIFVTVPKATRKKLKLSRKGRLTVTLAATSAGGTTRATVKANLAG